MYFKSLKKDNWFNFILLKLQQQKIVFSILIFIKIKELLKNKKLYIKRELLILFGYFSDKFIHYNSVFQFNLNLTS